MTSLKQCENRVEWDDYIFDNDGNPLQLWGWGELKVSNGWKADRLFFYADDGKIVGAVQVLIKPLPLPFRSLAYVPRGPVVDEDKREALLDELSAYVKRVYKSVAISIEPDSEDFTAPNGWIAGKNHILPKRTIILDLSLHEAEILSNMSKKTRQYIRKSAAEKLVIRRVTTKEQLGKCLEIYHQTAKRAGFALHSDQYYYDAFDKLRDCSQIFASCEGDQPVAFLWIVVSASTSYELYGGMNDTGHDLRANYNLKWHAIRKCKGWGIKRYDFGGLLGGGVSTFKLAWAKEPTELAGTFDKPLSKAYSLWSSALPSAKKVLRAIKRPFAR